MRVHRPIWPAMISAITHALTKWHDAGRQQNACHIWERKNEVSEEDRDRQPYGPEAERLEGLEQSRPSDHISTSKRPNTPTHAQSGWVL